MDETKRQTKSAAVLESNLIATIKWIADAKVSGGYADADGTDIDIDPTIDSGYVPTPTLLTTKAAAAATSTGAARAKSVKGFSDDVCGRDLL